MNTISLRMNDEDTKLLRVSVNKLNMSQFIRELIMTLEEEFEPTARFLHAHEKVKSEKKYDHTEVWGYALIMYRVEFSCESAVKALIKKTR